MWIVIHASVFRDMLQLGEKYEERCPNRFLPIFLLLVAYP